jgi:hypothetical protein
VGEGLRHEEWVRVFHAQSNGREQVARGEELSVEWLPAVSVERKYLRSQERYC